MRFHVLVFRFGLNFLDIMILGASAPGSWPRALFSFCIFEQEFSKKIRQTEIRLCLFWLSFSWASRMKI